MPLPFIAWSLSILAGLVAALPAHGGKYGSIPGAWPGDKWSDWKTWWTANRHRFAEPRESASTIEPAEFAGAFLPRLVDLVRSSEREELVAESLFALARGGRGRARDDVFAILSDSLHRREPRILEAAILGLGIVADPRSERVLTHIVTSSLIGREWLAQLGADIEIVLRIHACHALGLLANYGDSSVRLRTSIHTTLASLPRRHGEPMTVAVIRALGLIRVRTRGPKDETRLTRAVLRTLNRHWDQRAGARFIQSQVRVPLAVSRLLRRGDSGFHRYYIGRFLETLRKSSEHSLRRAAVVLGLGRIATLTDHEVSRVLRRHALHRAGTQSRYFAILALGEIGGGPNRLVLSVLLADPERESREWAAISLGILGRPRTSTRNAQLIQTLALHAGDDLQNRAAIAIAMGLVGGPLAARLISRLDTKSRKKSPNNLALGEAIRDARRANRAKPSGNTIAGRDRITWIGQLARPLRGRLWTTDERITAVREIASHCRRDLPWMIRPHRDSFGSPLPTTLRFGIVKFQDPGPSSLMPPRPGGPFTPGPSAPRQR